MRQNRAWQYLGWGLITIALLVLIISVVRWYALPILSTSINQRLLLTIAIVLAVAGLLANLNDIHDLVQKLLGKADQKVETGLLEVNVEKAVVKYIRAGDYHTQINLRFLAKSEDIYLKAIRLRTSQESSWADPNTAYGRNGFPVNFLMTYQEKDLLCLNPDKFYEAIQDLRPNSLKVRDLLITANSYLSITLLGDIHSERLSDGWEDLPLTGWNFLIEYGDDKQVNCQFSFSIHPSSPTRPVKFEHYGFQR